MYTNTLLDCCCLTFLPTAKNKRFSLSLCTKTWSSLCSGKIYILFIHLFFGFFSKQILKHEILIQNQVLFIQPPVEKVRDHLIAELHLWVAIITLLPRIQSSRYQVGTWRDWCLLGAFDSMPANLIALSLIPPLLVILSAIESQNLSFQV